MTEGLSVSFLSSCVFLPPANEVWGKVIFLHLSVILFTGGVACSGGFVPAPGGACSGGWGGVPGPGAAWW